MKNKIKRIIQITMIFVLIFFTLCIINIKADDTEVEMEPLVTSNGTFIYYKNTSENVMLPKEYEHDAYLRSVWVTPLAGCIPSYKSDTQYKNEINEVFDVMEYYNLNALIFHIRIMNDALYSSKLNPTSNYLNASWDVLEWIIDECHRRGFEFHAWLNPYRVKSSGGGSAETEAAQIKAKCPANVGSDPANLLVNSSGGVILNPGLEVVRQFIVDTCMEVIENYDVDAIHFDDYFYITGVDDDSTYKANNPNGLALADWRREQVNLFIEKLHDTVETYNKANNRYVQIGISPTGIYRNGDGIVTYDENGNAISSGSNTGGQEHYESYLFSDTVKWINEEWIDYIMPQSYWAFTQPIAGYADVMSWWNKIVKYKKVNLYSGMGIYMSGTPGKNYSWGYDPYESYNQILYASTLDNCDGTVFYNYTYLENTYKGETGQLYNTGLTAIKEELFNNECILPVIKSFDPVEVKAPTNISYSKNGNDIKLEFKKAENAKFYIIYRSDGNITFDEDEVYDIIYAGDSGETVTYLDENVSKKYNYAVRTQSPTNHLSEDAVLATFIEFSVVFKDNDGNVLKEEVVNFGGSATAPEITDENFVGWSKDFGYITSDLVLTPKYKDSSFYVNFYDAHGELLETKSTTYKGTVEAPLVSKEGYIHTGWEQDFSEVIYDMDVYPTFEEKVCKVQFVDWDDTEILVIEVKYGRSGYYPEDPARKSYKFVGWSESVDVIKDDMVIKAVYEPIMYKVTFVSGFDDSIISEIEVLMHSDVEAPDAPEVLGYEFYGWRGNMKNITCDMTIIAEYSEMCYEISFVDSFGNVIEEVYYFTGDEIYYPEVPSYEGYEFISWDRELVDIYDNLTITALYKKTHFKVTFVDKDGIVISEVVVKNGEEISYPEAPDVENYEFIGWDKELVNIENDTVVTALYKEFEKITITYVYDNQTIWSEEIYLGKDATFGFEVPEYEGFEFKGYDKEGKGLLEDTVITLLYDEIVTKDNGCNAGLILIRLSAMISLIGILSFYWRKK